VEREGEKNFRLLEKGGLGKTRKLKILEFACATCFKKTVDGNCGLEVKNCTKLWGAGPGRNK